jgi:tripartite-type tricarboxylate transporter receptor subunit TctC
MRILLAAALLFGGLAPAAQAADDFYKGKQIHLIIPTPSGGSYDGYARILANHMPGHIPGNPTMIAENMPGASGLKSANYIYSAAPKDGLTFAAGYSGLPTSQLLTPDGVQYDLNKFSWIGSITKDPFVGVVWHTSPIMTLEDLKTKEAVFGGSAIGAAGTDYAIIARDVLGFKLKIVTGYPNSPDMKIAMERRELDGTFATSWNSLNTTQPDWLRDKLARVIVQHGFKPHKDLPNVPLMIDQAKNEADKQVLELMMARQETSKPYFAPPGIPADRLNILRRAFDETIKDPAFIADVKKSRLDIDSPMTGEEAAEFVLHLSQTPQAVVKRIEQIFANFNNSSAK